MSSTTVLSVNNLSLSLGSGENGVRLVKGVSFQIPRKKAFGLMGESGCGKSLTCLSIMGLLPANIRLASGEVFFGDRPLRDLNPAGRRAMRGKTVAMVLQNPMSCFDPVFSIGHHFRETLASHGHAGSGKAERAARESLADVGFEDPGRILALYPFQMSGGMLQRVMVALAVMMDVSLLIADEPTTDLDVVSQTHILDLLDRIRQEHGMSLLLVTHDLSVIARLVDDLAVMKEGAIVESGPVETVFKAPVHPYTRALLQAHASLYGPELKKLLEPAAKTGQAFGLSAG